VKRLMRERGRLVVGVALLMGAIVAIGVGYASIANELFVAIQLPFILGAGGAALLCTGVGLVLLRSQDDVDTRARLRSLQDTHDAMTDRFQAVGVQMEYVTQLLEAVLQDDADAPARPAIRQLQR